MNPLIKDLAREQGIPPYAIRKWNMRGYVPHKYRLPMMLEAQRRGEELTESDFAFSKSKNKKRERVSGRGMKKCASLDSFRRETRSSKRSAA